MKKCQSLVTATKPCRPTPPRLCGSYLPLSKFGLEHPKLKQSGEQEEPLFMALIVKENLPLSTHRRPYLRFSEEARGPSGQSQLQPAQMRIDCTETQLFSRPRIETDEKGRSDLVLFLFAIQRASYFAGHGCQQNPPHYRIRDIIVSKPSPDQFKTCS